MVTTEQLSSICVQCGMCCDGTLFNRANIVDTDDEQAAANLGLTIVKNEAQKPFFLQPCPHFKTCCTVYNENRPKVCISFFCAPLRKVQKSLISFEAAQGIIENALNMRTEVLNLAANIEAFKNFSTSELFKEMDDNHANFVKQHPALLIKIAALRFTLKNKIIDRQKQK